MNSRSKIDYGDWQTDLEFAKNVCLYLKGQGINPEVLIEPTCGVGNFIVSALEVFDNIKTVYAIEIQKEYIEEAKKRLDSEHRQLNYNFINTSIFHFDFQDIVRECHNKNILVLGNPPWVTNSGQGKINGTNQPAKGNFKNAKGIEAITGKGNFDIAENVCYHIMLAFAEEPDTTIALLVKNSVVKNIVHQQHFRPSNISSLRQLNFDAKKEFGVSVSASLFQCKISDTKATICDVYDFYSQKKSHTFGWSGNAFTSNVDEYNETKFIDGESPLVWRSGIKHDCAKVMELSLVNNQYVNGLNEVVDIEQESIYPLLKSSDVGKDLKQVRKYLVLPQNNISEDTSKLKRTRPKTYSYLDSHASYLDNRKSIIYKNKPRFCVFGLGDYSFSPYKIVISALYKDLNFTLVEPINNCPVMVDDTCYSLGFDNLSYAKITLSLLQSKKLQQFIRNICFEDSKRIISRDSLMRIDLSKLLQKVEIDAEIEKKEIDDYKKWISCKAIPKLLFDF